MKVKTTKSERLLPRSKFLLLAQDFDKNGEKCLWNQLREGKSVEIDAKALLEGNGLHVPNSQSVKTFIEKQLGVEVQKCTKGEEALIIRDAEPEVEEDPNEEIEQEPNEENIGGEK